MIEWVRCRSFEFARRWRGKTDEFPITVAITPLESAERISIRRGHGEDKAQVLVILKIKLQFSDQGILPGHGSATEFPVRSHHLSGYWVDSG